MATDNENAVLRQRAYLIAKTRPLNDPYEADVWRMPYRIVTDPGDFATDDEAEIYEILPDGSLRIIKNAGSCDPSECDWIHKA